MGWELDGEGMGLGGSWMGKGWGGAGVNREEMGWGETCSREVSGVTYDVVATFLLITTRVRPMNRTSGTVVVSCCWGWTDRRFPPCPCCTGSFSICIWIATWKPRKWVVACCGKEAG